MQDIDLHDAIIENLSVNYSTKVVSIEVSYYPEPVHAKARLKAKIMFSEVERINEISDLLDLADNRVAGNIAYWHPAQGHGTTYIYLMSGVIAITAFAVEFHVNA